MHESQIPPKKVEKKLRKKKFARQVESNQEHNWIYTQAGGIVRFFQ
jgi:hypothetical protein